MTSSTRLSTIQSIYNKRAPTYDSEGGFHPAQAADYLKWMSLKPGQNVLDLACGTGAITIPAARAVESSGKVVGIDISDHSLSIARSKAEKENLHITFFQHDIAALDELPTLLEGGFDIITCASAFIFFENPASIVKSLAKLLKIGGKVIFDVPTRNSMVGGWVMNVVGHRLHMPVVYDRTEFDSIEKVKGVLIDAGLDGSETFITESYMDTEIDCKNGGGDFRRHPCTEERV